MINSKDIKMAATGPGRRVCVSFSSRVRISLHVYAGMLYTCRFGMLYTESVIPVYTRNATPTRVYSIDALFARVGKCHTNVQIKDSPKCTRTSMLVYIRNMTLTGRVLVYLESCISEVGYA